MRIDRGCVLRRLDELERASEVRGPCAYIAGLAATGLWTMAHARLATLEPFQAVALIKRISDLADIPMPAHSSEPAFARVDWDPLVDPERPILAGTLRLIERESEASVSLRTMAQETGLSVNSLQSTFGSIDRLLSDQIAYVLEDALGEGLPTTVKPARMPIADEINALLDPPRAQATFRIMTLSGLTRALIRRTLDPNPYPALVELLPSAQAVDVMVANLAIDAVELWDQGAVADSVAREIRALVTGEGSSCRSERGHAAVDA